jgi:hypothetical protein
MEKEQVARKVRQLQQTVEVALVDQMAVMLHLLAPLPQQKTCMIQVSTNQLQVLMVAVVQGLITLIPLNKPTVPEALLELFGDLIVHSRRLTRQMFEIKI